MKISQKLGLIILTVGVLLIVIAPLLLTRSLGGISFENTGQIGDTIGGITAPIASLIGSTLVFLALWAQIDANKLVHTQFEHQKEEESVRKLNLYLIEQIKIFREDFSEFNYESTRTTGTGPDAKKEKVLGKGSQAVAHTLNFCSKMKHHESDDDIFVVFAQLRILRIFLERIDYLMQKISEEAITEKDREYLQSLVRHSYTTNIQPFLKQYEKHRMSLTPPCRDCGKPHIGIPEDLYLVYDRLNAKYFPDDKPKENEELKN